MTRSLKPEREVGGGHFTHFSMLMPAARQLWAKSADSRGSPVVGHGLLAHMLDVAAVTHSLLQREPPQTRSWIAGQLGLPTEHVVLWLAALAGLHDWGKSIPGFQAKWPAGQQADAAAGLVFESRALQVTRHDLASAALLRQQWQRQDLEPGWYLAVAQALGAHHGYMPRADDVKTALPRSDASWTAVQQEIFDAYWAVFGLAEPPQPLEPSLAATAWLAGLTSVADWIGSNPQWFAPGERADELALHYQRAQDLAQQALDDIGWPAFGTLLAQQADTDTLVQRILGSPSQPLSARPLQQEADRLLAQASGPTLVLVEAPMGEGKTELAFLAHLRLQAANGHRGLYIALPTQATSNAMFERTLTFLRSFPLAEGHDIQLAHGGAALDERVHHLRQVNGSVPDSVASSAWLAQRKRPLLSPYGVGTVDQALLAVLHVKHHFVRVWGLANRVVVLDEVHAYDSYTSGLIESLLCWLRAMNCSVVLMSATLPARRRAAFLMAWGAQDRPDVAYPRVLLTTPGGTLGATVDCRTQVPIQVSGLPEDLDTLAQAALTALAGGGCGVVIVNTVKRAQVLHGLLQERLPPQAELLLFHARYPADERQQREQAVLARFGREAQRPACALLIATQVVEQSLDIDFDFMLSDLAPVDLLLQRAGRLHRHTRPRPVAHAQPRLTVAGLQPGKLPELKATAWGFVYDAYVLFRTWSIASKEPLWQLPTDIDRLVQAVYDSEPLQEEDRLEFIKTLDGALGEHLARAQEHRHKSLNVALNADDEPQNAYLDHPRGDEDSDDGLRLVTRLGEDSLSVVPIWVDADGWHLHPGESVFSPEAMPSDVLARRISQRQLSLSRKAVVLAMLAQPAVPSFDGHPLLKHLRPLLLTNGVARFQRQQVRLCPQLGLIYEPLTPEVP